MAAIPSRLNASQPSLLSHSSSSSLRSLGAGSSESHRALEEYKKKDVSKIVVRFKATGSAPIMKQNFFKISASNRFQTVIVFLRKELGLKQGDTVFLYINSSFSPAPDDTVANLFKCFSTEGHLIVNYSSTAAWG